MIMAGVPIVVRDSTCGEREGGSERAATACKDECVNEKPKSIQSRVCAFCPAHP